jgi:hypothetical protein
VCDRPGVEHVGVVGELDGGGGIGSVVAGCGGVIGRHTTGGVSVCLLGHL